MEFALGALSAIGAGIFTNPLEVVKTKMQLQGELKKRGQYAVHYKNLLHATYVIVKTDGISAVQKGLGPALIHQVLLNGVRLGGYQIAEDRKLNLNDKGEVSFIRTVAIGGVMGVVGAFTGSPLYLVKTRLQAQSSESIAVGHQHKLTGTWDGLKDAYRHGGIRGLWRGFGGSVPRMAIGSASQLSTFYLAKEFLADNKYYVISPGLLSTFVASMLGGVAVSVCMGPFDVISTRLYNQAVDKDGRGVLYKNFWDCSKKIWKTEGFPGLYKGITATYFRLGPHTVLCFVFWDQLKSLIDNAPDK